MLVKNKNHERDRVRQSLLDHDRRSPLNIWRSCVAGCSEEPVSHGQVWLLRVCQGCWSRQSGRRARCPRFHESVSTIRHRNDHPPRAQARPRANFNYKTKACELIKVVVFDVYVDVPIALVQFGCFVAKSVLVAALFPDDSAVLIGLRYFSFASGVWHMR